MRVNMGKTKIMKCEVGVCVAGDSGKWPCGVCRKGVGSNSLECAFCKKWIHKKCSGIKGRLKEGIAYKCPACASQKPIRKVAEEKVEIRMGQDIGIECVNKFCYLGDMIGAGGGAEDAARARVRCGWGKFR